MAPAMDAITSNIYNAFIHSSIHTHAFLNKVMLEHFFFVSYMKTCLCAVSNIFLLKKMFKGEVIRQ